ncbi:beta-N-acetylglucosaminidase domain-containing protein, partial [Streptomyces lasiicapitis]|uniref:beta-N-acetylglucosaminidase domain-containing protein n=1 Tax=Streptomyces lasiicapitis TaxID=1923961 RepID=UPI003658D13D
ANTYVYAPKDDPYHREKWGGPDPAPHHHEHRPPGGAPPLLLQPRGRPRHGHPGAAHTPRRQPPRTPRARPLPHERPPARVRGDAGPRGLG